MADVETKPKRKKTGGRKKGTPNKLKDFSRIEQLARDGIMPLDYMLAVMRDPKTEERRRDLMAVRAAPYCHATFASVKIANPHLPLAQIVAGMKPDELAAFENLIRNVVSRLQPERHALGYSGGEGAEVSGVGS